MALQVYTTASVQVLSSAVTHQGVTVAENGLLIQSVKTLSRPSNQKQGLVFCHGKDDQWDSPLNDGTVGPLLEAFVQSGPWVVYSVDAGGATAWGNDTAVTNVANAVEVLRTHVGVDADSIYGLGVSMGNLSVLNAWRADNSLFTRAVGLLPVVSLSRIHDTNVQTAAAEIATAYGGVYTTATEQATHDPEFYADSANNAHPFGASGDWLGFGSGADEWQVTPFAGNPWEDFAASNTHLNFREITVSGTHGWDQVQLVAAETVGRFLTVGALPS